MVTNSYDAPHRCLFLAVIITVSVMAQAWLFNRRVTDNPSCSGKFVGSKVMERQVLWKRSRTIWATIVGRNLDPILCGQSVEEVQ
jgi:hypothetical protein